MEAKQATTIQGVGVVEVIPENIPAPMKEFWHWIVWKAVLRENGKLDKVPYNPRTGELAATTDSRTWGAFPEALEAYESGDVYHGIGFVFSSGDPFVGVDFDEVRNRETGAIDARVLQYIERFQERYVEASASGCGVHLITRGKLRGGTKRGKYEIYGQERFFAMTGEVLNV